MKGSRSEAVPVVAGPVTKAQLIRDCQHLIGRVDEKNGRIDQVETELGAALRQNVALRQLLATRWSTLGYSLGCPGPVVAFIIKDVDGNRMEVSMD